MVIAARCVMRKNEFKRQLNLILSCLLAFSLLLTSGCATSDQVRLKESRNAFEKDDFKSSEAALYTPEVYQNDQNRLMHYYLLGSVAVSAGEYEKAVYYLNKARELALSTRSNAGTYEWFSSDYRSNPIEFSYIHYFLVMSYTLLAEAGQTPAWTTPEMKDKKENLVVPAQNFPARKFDNKEVASLKQKAHAELLAWDSFLEDLRRTYSGKNYYQEDVWARMLASYLHGASDQNSEKRTAELLVGDAKKILDHEIANYPSYQVNQEKIEHLLEKLKAHATGKNQKDSLFVLDAGVLAKYKIKRFHLGLSTIFSQIKDPALRRAMEQIGMSVILSYAPEFGLITLAGGVAGAMDNGDYGEDSEFEGPPRFFSDAVDRSFGFEIRFPTLALPPSDTRVYVDFSQGGVAQPEMAIPVVSPVEELVAVELKNREGTEMFERAIRVGLEYTAVLIPAIKTYQAGSREKNIFKKLGAVAGFYIAKKLIDNANNPDLRSWNYLPKIIAADVVNLQPGDYETKVRIENSFGKFEKDLGKFSLGNPDSPVVHARVGDVPILNHGITSNGKKTIP